MVGKLIKGWQSSLINRFFIRNYQRALKKAVINSNIIKESHEKTDLFFPGSYVPLGQEELLKYIITETLKSCKIRDGQIYRNCLRVNYNLIEVLRKAYHKDCLFTIGGLSVKGKILYNPTSDNILHEIKKAASGKISNIHCWISLPDGRILDPTINFNAEDKGSFLIIPASMVDTCEKHYKPLLVGERLFERYLDI